MKVLLHVNYYEGAGKFDRLFKLIRVSGADGVELRAARYYDMDKSGYWHMVEELKQKNPEAEIVFGYPLHFTTVDEETQKREFEDYVTFLDWAHGKLGTTLLNMYTDNFIDPAYAYSEYDKQGSTLASEEDYVRHGEGLTRAGRELEKRGMLAGLESHNCYIHDTATSCRKLLDHVQSDAIGINYDHGNIFLNSKGESIDDVFKLLKGRIYYAHLKNGMKTTAGQYLATHLADGYIDTAKVLEGLKSELKSGIFTIEYSCPGDGLIAAKTDMEYIRYLREWLDF